MPYTIIGKIATSIFVIHSLCGCMENTRVEKIGNIPESQSRHGITEVGKKDLILGDPIQLKNIELEEDYEYVLFDATDELLCWIELYTGTLYVYNLQESQLARKITLRQGQGPGEYTSITGMTITQDNFILLSDINRGKLIRLNIESGEAQDLKLSESRPMRLLEHKGRTVISEMSATPSLVGEVKGNGEIRRFVMSEAEPPPNGFFRSGEIEGSGSKIAFAPTYQPLIHIFDLESGKQIGKLQYDSGWVKELPSPREMTDGTVVTLPPDASARVIDISNNTAHSDQILLVVEGEGENIEYDKKQIYVFDLSREEIVKVINLDIEAGEVAANSNSIFIYDSNDFKIYEYDIL